MFHLALYQPEIPPNTGNIIRLAANSGVKLHLIKPLGFIWDDKRLQRAGLDYHEFTGIIFHENFSDFQEYFKGHRQFALSTKGQIFYHQPHYQPEDVFILGPETRGLPPNILESFPQDHILKIPMQQGSRSLNLSNAAAVIVYEAWRQVGFEGGIRG